MNVPLSITINAKTIGYDDYYYAEGENRGDSVTSECRLSSRNSKNQHRGILDYTNRHKLYVNKFVEVEIMSVSHGSESGDQG